MFGQHKNISSRLIALDKNHFLLNVIIEHETGEYSELDLGNYANSFEYEIELLGEQGARGQLLQHNELILHSNRSEYDYAISPKEVTLLDWPTLEGGFSRTGYLGAMESFIDSVRNRSTVDSSLTSCLISYQIIEKILNAVKPSQ